MSFEQKFSTWKWNGEKIKFASEFSSFGVWEASLVVEVGADVTGGVEVPMF